MSSRGEQLAELRVRAERRLAARSGGAESLEHDLHAVMYELNVHQLELQMQVDQLIQSRDRLEEAQARYQELHELAPIAFVTMDDQGVMLEANLAACDLFGIRRERLVGTRIDTFTSGEAFSAVRALLAEVFAGPDVCGWEIALRPASGPTRHIRIEAYQSRRDVTGPAICRAALIDVTEARALTDAQRDRELFLLRVIDALPDGMLVIGGTGRIELANDAAVELLGPHWWLIGRPVAEIFAPPDGGAALDLSVLSELAAPASLTARRASGHTRAVRVRVGELPQDQRTAYTLQLRALAPQADAEAIPSTTTDPTSAG